MNFFNDALSCLPPNWETHDYTSKIYVLVDLEESSTEYQDIKTIFHDSFGDSNIKEIKRIQHPFAYLRYKLKMEFLGKWREPEPNEKRIFEKVKDDELDKFIEYNCDNRRVTHASDSTNYVIKKYVNLYPERDTNWYPEYLVKV